MFRVVILCALLCLSCARTNRSSSLQNGQITNAEVSVGAEDNYRFALLDFPLRADEKILLGCRPDKKSKTTCDFLHIHGEHMSKMALETGPTISITSDDTNEILAAMIYEEKKISAINQFTLGFVSGRAVSDIGQLTPFISQYATNEKKEGLFYRICTSSFRKACDIDYDLNGKKVVLSNVKGHYFEELNFGGYQFTCDAKNFNGLGLRHTVTIEGETFHPEESWLQLWDKVGNCDGTEGRNWQDSSWSLAKPTENGLIMKIAAAATAGQSIPMTLKKRIIDPQGKEVLVKKTVQIVLKQL